MSAKKEGYRIKSTRIKQIEVVALQWIGILSNSCAEDKLDLALSVAGAIQSPQWPPATPTANVKVYLT
jgi:hypothetical protein